MVEREKGKRSFEDIKVKDAAAGRKDPLKPVTIVNDEVCEKGTFAGDIKKVTKAVQADIGDEKIQGGVTINKNPVSNKPAQEGINRFAPVPEAIKIQKLPENVYLTKPEGDAVDINISEEPDGDKARKDVKKSGPGANGDVYTAS